MNLFDWTLGFQGYDIAFAKAELSRIQQQSETDFATYVEDQKKAIVAYHKKHNLLYQQLTKKVSTDDWASLPILTKTHLQQPLEQRLSSGYTSKKVYVNKTSGSSGHPFVFAKDKACHALTWAVIMDRFQWYGIDFNRSLQARFYGIPLDTIGYRKERLKDWLSHRYRFPIFDLSDTKLEGILGHFKRKPFDYINGYTSSIVLFAKYLKRKHIVLKTLCPLLKVCMVTSEMLFESDKKLLETQLGIPVVNEYGASELDLIAFQNTAGDFQVNSETLYVEILDDHHQPVPMGEEGHIVITSLYNKAHPFIRYEVGDLGVLSEKSTPKKPILKQLLGRANDNATLTNGTTVPGHTFYYVTKTALGIDSPVKEFLIEQNALDTFTLVYSSSSDLSPSEILALEESLLSYLKVRVVLQTRRVEVMDRSNRGKLKQFVSRLPKSKPTRDSLGTDL